MFLDGIEPQESHGDQGQPASSQLGLVVGGHSDHVEEQLACQGPGPETEGDMQMVCWMALAYNFNFCRSLSPISRFLNRIIYFVCEGM